MDKYITALKDTPVPNILIFAGIFFIFLAIVGKIAGKVEVPAGRQRLSLAIGTILLISGLSIYFVQLPPRQKTTTTDEKRKQDVDIYSAALSWPIKVEGAFTPNFWNVTPFQNEYVTVTKIILDGRLRWEAKFNTETPAPGGLGRFVWEHLKNVDDVHDFYLSVDARLVSGDPAFYTYALIFRFVGAAEGNVQMFYTFSIADTKYYEVAFYDGNKWIQIIPWTFAPAIKPGEYNHMEAVAEGSSLHFYINGQPVGSAEDNRSLFGKVGVLVQGFKAGDEVVEFKNFKLHQKPNIR